MLPLSPRIFISKNRIYSIPSRSVSYSAKFWNWTTQQRPHWRKDYKEAVIIFCVFGITGSSTLIFVRPSLKYFGIEGTLIDGPNSYRIASILLISPIYAMILFTLGTLSGRHNFFAKMAMHTLGRFLPKKVSSTIVCQPAKQKNIIASTSSTNNVSNSSNNSTIHKNTNSIPPKSDSS